MFNDLNKYAKNLFLKQDDYDNYCAEQTKYLTAIFKSKDYISIKDVKKSYRILEKYQSKTYKNRVREFTNKPKVIENIEKIVKLRQEGCSHDKISKVVPLSKATIQKYLKLLEITNG